MRGETVILRERYSVGNDPFGNPRYEYTESTIEDVIVGQSATDPAVTGTDLDGGRIAFTLGVPKGDKHNWIGAEVLIRGERFKTIGRPLVQTEENVPGRWNAQVKVERYE